MSPSSPLAQSLPSPSARRAKATLAPKARPVPTTASEVIKDLLVVVAITAAAVAPRMALSSVLNDRSAFLFFTLAVMLGSWYRGLRVGLLATACGGAVGWTLFVEPYRLDANQDRSYFVQLLLFVCISVTASAINEAWHRVKRQLTAHEEFLSNILETTPMGVLVLDHEGFVTYANHAAAELFGLGSGLLVGRPCAEIGLRVVPAPGSASALPPLEEFLRHAAENTPLQLMIEDASTTGVAVDVRTMRFRGINGQPAGLVLSLIPVEAERTAHV